MGIGENEHEWEEMGARRYEHVHMSMCIHVFACKCLHVHMCLVETMWVLFLLYLFLLALNCL